MVICPILFGFVSAIARAEVYLGGGVECRTLHGARLQAPKLLSKTWVRVKIRVANYQSTQYSHVCKVLYVG